jgi:hypothetical protein
VNPFKVFIPTTRGAARILSITKEAPEIRSVLCIEGSFEALPVSTGYDQFVRRPTGVVEKLLGEGSYRTDLDKPITQGDSWQLGLLLAHVLHAADRLTSTRIGPSASGAVWASGEVTPALDIRPVDHMRQKFNESCALLQEMHDGGTRVTLLLHPTNLEDIADLVPEDWNIIAADTVRDAIAGIGLELAMPPTTTAPVARPQGRRRARLLIGVGLGAAMFGLIAYHLPVQALRNAITYEQAGQHRALLMEIRTNLARKNWVVTNAFYFFEVFYLGSRSQRLAEALDITISTDDASQKTASDATIDSDIDVACRESLVAGQRIETVFPMLPAAGCQVRLTVENSFANKVRVWLAVTSEGVAGTPEVKFRSGADLQPGDRFQTPPFAVTNDGLTLYAVVSDRPDFGWRKWFENLIQTPDGPVTRANIERLTGSGIGVVVARQPETADFQ